MNLWNSYSEFLDFGYTLNEDITLVYGQHIFSIKGLCGGRSVIGSRRLTVDNIIKFLKSGDTVEYISQVYAIPIAAIQECIEYYKLTKGEKV